MTSCNRGSFAPSTRGMVLSWVILAFLFMVVLIGTFAMVSRQGASSAHRYQLGETVRQVLESASDEAFTRLGKETANADSPSGRWFSRNDGTALTIQVPMAQALASRLLRSGWHPTVSAEVRCVDFRSCDSSGNRYQDGDGVGTFEIMTRMTFPNPDSRVHAPDYTLVRHHEFRLASLVTPPDRRSSTAPNALLDYAWFSRRGGEEFIAHAGEDANSTRVRFSIVQTRSPEGRKGLLFLGGDTHPAAPGAIPGKSSSQPLFLNTTEAFGKIIPVLPPTEVGRVGFDDLRGLFPPLAKAWEDAGRPDEFRRLAGIFTARNLPLCLDATGATSDIPRARTLLALLEAGMALGGPEANSHPLLGWALPQECAHPEQAEALFRGTVRQRFLYLVTFTFDPATMDALSGEARDRLNQVAESILCLPPTAGNALSEGQRAFNQGLAELEARRGAGTMRPLHSVLNKDFVFSPGQAMERPQSSFPKPELNDPAGVPIADLSGPDGARLKPFPNINLYARRYQKVVDLEKTGQYERESGVLHLRGITRLSDRFTTERSLRIEGRGVLIADGFLFRGGISKTRPDDLAVFVSSPTPRNPPARSPGILLETSDEIQAALAAIGPRMDGTIRPGAGKTLNVVGSLIADSLTPSAWSPNVPHRLEFDPLLRSEKEIRSISLSSTVIFRRVVIAEDET